MDLMIKEYKKWLNEHVLLSDLSKIETVKQLVLSLLMGKNYRIVTEIGTKELMFITYIWINKLYEKAKKEYGNNWQEEILNNILRRSNNLSREEKYLLDWLVGLTNKTRQNLGLNIIDYQDYLQETKAYLNKLIENMKVNKDYKDLAWMLMIAGSATLTIRGSRKAKIGKKLERVFLKTCLLILGFEENENFWMNIERDEEVGREIDGEVRTKRGRARIEVGLIGEGNQEVIEDKISRVGQKGIVIFDKIGAKSSIYNTATAHGVKLIQIRHNQPLVELYRYLKTITDVDLKEPPQDEKDLKKAIDRLPKEIFSLPLKG